MSKRSLVDDVIALMAIEDIDFKEALSREESRWEAEIRADEAELQEASRNGDRQAFIGVVKSAPPVDDWLTGSPMDPCAVSPEPLDPLSGFPFMHEGMAAVISGPTGKGRSSVVEACAYDAARAGLRVAYLGGEVTEIEFNARAALLVEKRGDDPQRVRSEVAGARYLDLEATLAAAWKNPKRWIEGIGKRYDIVVVDPLNDALAATQSKHENEDYVAFFKRLIAPLRESGTAVVMLDNVGHAEDAQDRPIGPSSKGHKADLVFSCTVQQDPKALRLTAKKVRSVRAAFGEGATWECDEATLRVAPINGPVTASRPKRPRERQREERKAAILAAVSEKRLSARQIAASTQIPRATLSDLLDALCADGKIDSTAEGWGWPQEPSPEGSGIRGHPQVERLADTQNCS